MSATLSYDLKKCMPLLTKDQRWDVLTVLILHANIRNRCYVGMDTIAELATGGNLAKATRAKKWLEAHSAFELVPYNKRVGDEIALPKRQHVYQLTGNLKHCADRACECQNVLKTAIFYLYHGDTDAKNADVSSIENINVSSIENIRPKNTPNVSPIENFNGINVSIPNKEKEKKESDSLPPSISIALDRANEAGKTPSDNGMMKQMNADALIRGFERAHRESGAPQTVRRGKHVYEAAIQYWEDGYRENEVYQTVVGLIEEKRPVAFVFLSEALSDYRVKHKIRLAPKEVINGNARPVAIETNWKREAANE